MKLAVVADHVLLRAGSERVFQYICQEFPEADTFACAYNLRTTWDYFSERPPKATWLNYFVRSHQAFQNAFPIATYAMQSLDLRKYDAVFSLSASVAKYVRAREGRHVCYCFVPTRALWNEDNYLGKGIKRRIFSAVRTVLCRRDYDAAQRVDHFLCISERSRDLIRQYYDRSATVIYSPIDTERFVMRTGSKGDHYLLVSRLERWKKVEYAIEAFNKTGDPLRIIGTGSDEAQLKRMAGKNIEFVGSVSDEILVEEYSRAAAVIFTPELEYGLIPLEACATGTPVICYGRGGVIETMRPWNRDTAANRNATAVFFYDQTADALIGAVRQFEACRSDFDPTALRFHANTFSVATFQKNVRHEVERFVQGVPQSVAQCAS